MTKIRSITKYYKTTKLAGMTYHLINKAVMKQNCIEALNQHAQLLESCPLEFHLKLCQSIDQDH